MFYKKCPSVVYCVAALLITADNKNIIMAEAEAEAHK